MTEPLATKTAIFDVAVIGAGVVGCAMARRFALEGARVVLLEKSTDILSGASKGNSAILHTGFDAPPGSIELACMQEGYREYRDIHARLNLPLLETGALVAAWSDEDLARLPAIVEQAHGNGVDDVRQVGRDEVLALEPQLAGNSPGNIWSTLGPRRSPICNRRWPMAPRPVSTSKCWTAPSTAANGCCIPAAAICARAR
ncbi:FAD dependent oxidoreductase [Klebsiella pneumoniae]|nr:FAD dependent oxidoreductase [Klebsiella pneumoniae]